MEQWLYVMFIEKTKTYNRLTKAAVERHVENLRQLDDGGHIALAGVFKGYPGVAGMYILKADSLEEAEALCQREPLVEAPPAGQSGEQLPALSRGGFHPEKNKKISPHRFPPLRTHYHSKPCATKTRKQKGGTIYVRLYQ